VIYGGHSHLTYSSAIPGNVRKGATLVAEVRNAGVEYSRTSVCIKISSNRVVGSAVEYVSKADAAKFTPDATAAALVKKYKDQLAPKLDVKIGTVDAVFPRGGSPAVERSGETPLGNFTADAIRAKYKTDFVILNGGGIRDTFPAKTFTPLDKTLVRPATSTTGPYDVTVGDALTIFPFGNSVSTTTITGTLLWKALENGVGGAYPADGRFPQISGFKFTFDSSKPIGSRVVTVTKLDGTPIAKDATVYTVSTLDYVVQGGDGYVGVFSPATAKVRDLLVDVFIEAVKAQKDVKIPSADGRTKKVG
jgi:5'-nucleotidase